MRASPEQLRRWYWDERKNCVEIGSLVGRDPKTVWSWMATAGIPTRRRGGASSPGSFSPGQVSAFKGKRHTLANRERFRTISIADGRVPYLKNGKHHLKGKRGADTPNWKGGHTPERQAFYSTAKWRAACVAVWHRADAKCERCGADHRLLTKEERGSFHVHHIVSFRVRALRADPTNLALLCAGCHRFVHSKANESREFLKQ